jgi:sugar lactone lactonase YvrE
MSDEALACSAEQSVLGEGPRWDDRRNELLRVDILAGRVFRDRIADDGDLVPVRVYDVPGTVGAVAPVHGDGGWVLATNRGFARLSYDGALRALTDDVAPPGTRMNDAACDPQGRFWAGTVAHDQRPGAGELYRLDPDGSTHLVHDGLTISNGLGWSPDGRTMYVTDSVPGVIHAFGFDGATGAISDGRVLIDVPDDLGGPDGLTVDAGGDLWVAIWGGGRIHRYSPDGELRAALAIPAEQTTSCAFGGPNLRTLYVTTGTENWTDEQRRANPNAGLVYRIETTAGGTPAALFRPEASWWVHVTS